MPVTISGCWNSSPIFFQYSRSAKTFSCAANCVSSVSAPSASGCGGGCGGGAPAAPLDAGSGVGTGDVGQIERIGVDHPQRALVAQLAAQQPHRFEVAVDFLGAGGEEAGNVDPRERPHVQLRLDRRLDRHLDVSRTAAAHCGREDQANDRLRAPSGH